MAKISSSSSLSKLTQVNVSAKADSDADFVDGFIVQQNPALFEQDPNATFPPEVDEPNSSSSSSSSSSNSVVYRPVSKPLPSSSSSATSVGTVSVAVNVPIVNTPDVPIEIIPGAIAASGTQNSDLRLSNLTRSINAINNSNSRLSPKSGILSSSLVKLDFVNILYNKGFPADANHAELYFPTKNSNPHFTISAKSLPERILLDIISFSDIPLDSNDKKFSGNFVFAQNPFSVNITSIVSGNSKAKFEKEIVKFLDFNRNKSIINIKLQDVYKYVGRVFPFDLNINFVDASIQSSGQDLGFNVIRINLNETAVENFDGLSVGVQKNKQSSASNFFYIKETYKFVPEVVLSIQGAEFADCNNTARNLKINDFKHENDIGIVSDVTLNVNFKEIIPYAFPLFYIEDRERLHYNSPTSKYFGSRYSLHTKIKHTNYNISNQLFFYDQVVNRSVGSIQDDGSIYSKHHSIFEINDTLKSLVFDQEKDESGKFIVNNLEFRREYIPEELTSSAERSDYDANYFLHINATKAVASNRIAKIGEFRINSQIRDPIRCKLGYFIEDKIKVKDNFNIKLYSITSIGDESNPRIFARSLTVSWSSSTLFKYGKYLTYGSGKKEDNGYELNCLSIKDIVDIIESNIAGNVSELTPDGESSSICQGLFPTLREIAPSDFDSDTPCIEFSKSSNYTGFYLFPLSRMWLGNTDSSVISSKLEKNEIVVSNSSPQTRSIPLYCRGLEKDVDLTNMSICTPIARKVGRSKVRHAIKDFFQHANDRDFEQKSKGGKSDSRFYKFNTIIDSINILREGFSFFSSTKKLLASESSYYFGRSSGNKKVALGSRKKIIGLAQLGISTPITSTDQINGDAFHSEYPSYILSGFSKSNIESIESISIKKYINIFEEYDNSIKVVYRNSEMFPQRTSSFQPISAYLSDFANSVFYPYGGVFTGGNATIFFSTCSDDGYTEPGQRLSRDYIIGSSSLLSLNNHNSDKQCMAEGGELSSSTRYVGIHACYDTGSSNIDMSPNPDFIKNELLSLAQASGNLNGNISSSYLSKINGRCSVNGTGKLSNEFNVTFKSKSIELIYPTGEMVSYKNQLRFFLDIMQLELGDRSNIKVSPNYSLNDPVSPELLLIEYRYLTPFVQQSSSTSSIDFIPIDPIDPYDPYDSYSSANLTSSVFSKFDEYSTSMGIFDEYDAYDVYDAYETITEIDKQFRDMGFANINERQVTTIKILEKKPVNKTYKFPLKQGFSYSLSDLILDVNKTMASFGIKAISLINNPGRFLANKLDEKEEILLTTNIIYVTDVIEEHFNIPPDPYDSSYDILDPYGIIIKRYGSIDPYLIPETGIITSHVRSKQKQKTVYDPRISGTVQGAIEADSTYSVVVKINPFENSSGISAIKDNIKPYESSVYLSRPRYDSTVDALLKNQNIQSGSSQLNTRNLPVNDNTVLIPSFTENASIESFETAITDDAIQFRSVQTQQATTPGQPNVKAIQVSYAGSIKDSIKNINTIPNTFFESGNNIFGDIQFNTKEADYVILAVRLRTNNDPFFYPESSDFNAHTNLSASLVARIEYSNGELIEVISAINDSEISSSDFIQIDINDRSQEVSIKPVLFKIPLKSLISYITFSFSQFNTIVASSFIKVLNSPIELDQFGFLALNNTNPRYSMNNSRVSKSFGLVLDNVGSWDILISPEASLTRVTFGDFDLPNGASFARNVFDTEERFIVGIGKPIINADNDITGFDTSSIPSIILDNISLLPVPNYQQVWILKVQSGLKNYLMTLRATAGPQSLEGCYIDIPIFAQGMISGSEGTANIRIFTNTECVFDYKFCEFFWNLGTPLVAPGAFIIQNAINIRYEELIDCDKIAERIPNTNTISIFNYALINIDSIPALDNGTGLLLLKTDANLGHISNIFWPPSATMSRLKRIPESPPQSQTPWEYNCEELTPLERNTLNRTILYTNPNNLSIFETNLVSIATLIKTANSYMLIQPRINFPPEDDGDRSYTQEKIIGSVGFVFKNWRSTTNWLFNYKLIYGFESILDSSQSNFDIFVPLTYKYYYNEDRVVV